MLRCSSHSCIWCCAPSSAWHPQAISATGGRRGRDVLGSLKSDPTFGKEARALLRALAAGKPPGACLGGLEASDYQFRGTSTEANGDLVQRIGRLDVNPQDAHVASDGPHLNLETQVNGRIVSNIHVPIDPTTSRPGNLP
jgi:hypothetical protein